MLAALALAAGPPADCSKTFTVPMIERAIHAAYNGTRDVSALDRAHLRRFIRCARRPGVHASMNKMWSVARAQWNARRHPPMAYAVASWYDDSNGRCAAGWCATYGVANLSLPFGTKVMFAYHGRSVEATVDDRGPYVGGRTWDLDQRTAGALGFGGVDTVAYHIR
jgi:rare lipoprotein A (peptidoglycan hydrolase)